jgi:hypothetical protein
VSYTESLLASGERIVKTAHQHWFVLVWRSRWAVLGLVVGLVFLILRFLNRDTSGFLWTLLGRVTVVLVILGVLVMVWGYLRYRAEEYVISSRRLIHVEGVIGKKASDSSLEKINDAILVEPLLGRIFGFGNLEVLTASESGIEQLHMLRDAKEFKKSMLEAKHDLEIELTRPTMPPFRASEAAPVAPVAAPPVAPAAAVAPVPTPAVDTADEVADALSRLGDLRDRGIISPEEFAAKKAELLGRL